MNVLNTQRPPEGPDSDVGYADVIVVTGTMGSGKSRVSSYFEKLGATVIRADELARLVVQPGTPAYTEIVQEFSEGVLHKDGTIDRKNLAATVFADSDKRRRLEQITHPRIREAARQAFKEARAKNPPMIVYDCPLFFEGGLDRHVWKRVVVVSAERAKCIERVVKRDGITAAEVEQRMAAQIPIERKSSRANIVIDNNGGESALERKVLQLFQALSQPGTK